MKIWLKMLFAIVLGILLVIGLIVFNIFFPDLNIFLFSTKIFNTISKIAINFLLYLTLLYVLIKAFLGFLSLRSNKNIKKITGIFAVCIIISVFFSIIVSMGFMNLGLFKNKNKDLPQQSSTIKIPDNLFDKLLFKVINENIFTSFQGTEKSININNNSSNDSGLSINEPTIYILPILFISLLFALAAFHSNKKGDYFVESVESFDSILDKIIRQILEFFPVGAVFIVAAFLSTSIFKNGTFSLQENLNFIINPLIAILLITSFFIVLYALCLYIFIKKKTPKFFLSFFGAGLISLTTGNPAAAIIPLTEHLKNNSGIKKEVADTLGPFGMIINKTGTVIISTVILFTLMILIYSEDVLKPGLQFKFFVLILLFSFILDGYHMFGFLLVVASILSFETLHLEEDSYLLFLVFIPIFARIGAFIDTLSTAVLITITAKLSGCYEDKRYIEHI